MGSGDVWTRRGRDAARGTVAIDGGPPRAIDALAVVDETAGDTPGDRVALGGRRRHGRGRDAARVDLVEGVDDPSREASAPFGSRASRARSRR